MLTIFSCPKPPTSRPCPDSPPPPCFGFYCVSVAVLCRFATHDLTYATGLNLARGGPTRFRKSKDDMVDVSREVRLGVQIKFICENLRSHSALAIGMLLTATSNSISSSGMSFPSESVFSVGPYDWARVGNVKALAQRLNLSLPIQRTCVLGPVLCVKHLQLLN